MVEKLHSKTSTLSRLNTSKAIAWSAGLALSAFLLTGCGEKTHPELTETEQETTQALPPCSEQIGPPNCAPETSDTTGEPVDVCQALGNIASALNQEPIDINKAADNILELANGGMGSDPAVEEIIADFGALNPNPEDEALVGIMQDSVSAAQNTHNC